MVGDIKKGLKPYEKDILAKLTAFHEDDALTVMEFPSTLTGNERQSVHYLAELFGTNILFNSLCFV